MNNDPQAQPQNPAQTQTETETETETETDTVTVTETQAQIETDTDAKAEAEAEAEADIDTVTETQAQIETDTEVEAEADIDTVTVTVTETQAQAQTQPKAQADQYLAASTKPETRPAPHAGQAANGPAKSNGADASLTSKLEAAYKVQDKRAILEETPIIKKLLEKLPGAFVGYFNAPIMDAHEAASDDDDSDLGEAGDVEADHGPGEDWSGEDDY